MVFVAGSVALSLGEGAGVFSALNTVSTLCYAVVTILLYELLKPVSKSVSLVAALFGITGCTVSLFHLAAVIHVPDLVFFGFHCLFIGYLIIRSTFLPRILGVLMMLAGLGWLTFGSQPLANSLAPYNFIPGMVGEGLLTLWLLVKGVDVPKWMAAAGAAKAEVQS